MLKWMETALGDAPQPDSRPRIVPEDLTNNGRQKRAAPPVRFAVSATFTAEPIAPALRFWARRLGREFEVRFAPYNQILQTLHDPSSEFAANDSGLNLILARVEDLGQFNRLDAAALGLIEENVNHLAEALAACCERRAVP